METRTLGNCGLTISALGLGCMGMNWSYGPPKDKVEMISRTVPRFDPQNVRRTKSWPIC